MELWDKQAGETPKAFTAFTEYLKLGERSLAKLTEKLGKPSGYTRQLQTWSSDYEWVARAAAFDEHIDVQAREKAKVELVRRRTLVLERDWTMADKGHALIERMMKQPLTTQRVERERYDPDRGAIIEEVTIEPTAWNLNTARQLMETVSKLGRLATGLETDSIKVEMEVQAQLEELLSELRGALSPSALAELHAYISARSDESTEERITN